jgi:hypothetical protein
MIDIKSLTNIKQGFEVKTQGKYQPIPANSEPIDLVTCECCGAHHRWGSKDYLTFAGSVFVGPDGGLIGNNLDDDGRLYRTSIYCLKARCFLSPFQGVFPMTAINDGGVSIWDNGKKSHLTDDHGMYKSFVREEVE